MNERLLRSGIIAAVVFLLVLAGCAHFTTEDRHTRDRRPDSYEAPESESYVFIYRDENGNLRARPITKEEAEALEPEMEEKLHANE